MLFRLGDVSLGHIDAERRKSRPDLLAGVENAAGAAADVEDAQAAYRSTSTCVS
jgi:hypothetical protein